MTQNVIESLEVIRKIDVLLRTTRDGVSALETASTMIHIPTREMAKIDTAIRKMREAALYIEDRAYNVPVKGAAITKSALKEALKGASQEQIERAYAILSGQCDGPKGRSRSTEGAECDAPKDDGPKARSSSTEGAEERSRSTAGANDSVDETTGEEEAYLPPPEWNEG